MQRFLAIFGFAAFFVAVTYLGRAEAEPAAKSDAAPAKRGRVYGEWRIQVRPDKVNEYAQLIETTGLPLFRAAGGRMVGWWTTLIGDLYEHITIWEYDDMAAFEGAVHKLGKDKRFSEFVTKRDPLLAGEENRFLHLAEFAIPPALPEQAQVVVHEVHRVPLSRRDEYLQYMRTDGLDLLRRHGFHPVGPWVVAVGNWSEVSYLFRFDSLRERDDLIAAFASKPDAQAYSGKINAAAEEVTTRILVPAKFAQPAPDAQP